VRLLMVVNVDWFFLSHRLPIALEAIKQGHEVHLATSLTEPKERLEAFGLVVHPLNLRRSNSNPVAQVSLFFELLRLFRRLRPQVIHLVTIKPVLVGGLAARFSRARGVAYAISGLGHVFVDRGIISRLRRFLIGKWYRVALGVTNKRVIFQNVEDKRLVSSFVFLEPEQTVMIPGSGVDLSLHQSTALQAGPPVVAMFARLLTTKGVLEFVQAARQIKLTALPVRFWLVGDPDPENLASISVRQINEWKKEGVVEILGHRSDVSELMAASHIIVLPSYREGLPKVLIEAAASGRAVITTDVPGCRDAIIPGETGLLIPVRDVYALQSAISLLVRSPERCAVMGRAARKFAECRFDVKTVVDTHLKIYECLANRK